MNSTLEPLKKWFGYSRRERRSTFILLLIILFIIALRYIVPEKNMTLEDLSINMADSESASKFITGGTSDTVMLFPFDPNTASYDTFLRLGLSDQVAGTIINYREKGGKFKQPSDIKRIYGIDGGEAEKLVPFIKVSSDITRNLNGKFYPQKKPLLDINSCDSASLVKLPGIGPVLSARIIKFRHLLGGFASVSQLKEVYGLKEDTYDLISDRVFADTTALIKININNADFKSLSRHPYFERYEVTAILKFRELNGRIIGVTDLTDNKLITVGKALKLKPYLEFGKY